MISKEDFRALTQRVMDAEKPGFWSDWTPEQQALHQYGDWKAFSRSRGYTEAEISECDLWLSIIDEGKEQGINVLEWASDIVSKKAIENVLIDKRGEIGKSSITPSRIRGQMVRLENAIKSHPLAQGPEEFPLTHTFTNGQYVRESFMPAGYLFTTRIHKVEHPMFLMSGDVSILTADGFKRVKAPYYTITKPGTKRVVLTHEDTVCITVHPTQSKTVEEVEKELWTDSFEDLGIEYEKELICQE
jgi:hypothetical protein